MRSRTPAILAVLTLLAGCYNPFADPFGPWWDWPSSQPDRIVEATEKFSLATGGVAPGRDELVIYDQNGNPRDFSGQTLECEADDDIVQLGPRPDYNSAAEGSGVLIVATAPGVTAIRCSADGTLLEEVYEVTIPPQSLIQIIMAEAGRQLDEEAQIDEDLGSEVVSLDSQSPTGDGIGSVIRNRIELINTQGNPALFGAEDEKYTNDPPASYYEAVIMAENQFSPTDPSDPSHDVFDDAQDRNFLQDSWLIAYDQAVLTAAGVFNGDIEDPTGGAFAFRSPTQEQWDVLAQNIGGAYIPEGSGFSDSSFPALAPIQILIHPEVWTYDDGRPSFVFARERSDSDPAIVNNP